MNAANIAPAAELSALFSSLRIGVPVAAGELTLVPALVNRLPVKNSGRDRARVRCEATPVA
jgi:hypothetical protein